MDKEPETHLEGMEKRLSKDVTKSIEESEKRLAATIGEVVTLIDSRFDVVDKRFDSMDEHFGQVDKRLDSIEEKLSPLVNQVSGHEKRVSFIEARVLSQTK